MWKRLRKRRKRARVLYRQLVSVSCGCLTGPAPPTPLSRANNNAANAFTSTGNSQKGAAIGHVVRDRTGGARGGAWGQSGGGSRCSQGVRQAAHTHTHPGHVYVGTTIKSTRFRSWLRYGLLEDVSGVLCACDRWTVGNKIYIVLDNKEGLVRRRLLRNSSSFLLTQKRVVCAVRTVCSLADTVAAAPPHQVRSAANLRQCVNVCPFSIFTPAR